ncbi:MAG: MFS transporter [Alphaproteobacteria bacterium]|nr:MAG: MFS transporter [Alphaproteobacteria bacterium]
MERLSIDFGHLWRAHSANQVAFETILFVLPTLAATLYDASPGEIALVTAASTLPALLFALPAGVWIDRRTRAPVLRLTALARAVLVVGLTAGLWFGLGTPVQLAVMAFCFAGLAMVGDIAAVALVPQLVQDNQLGRANARLELMRSLAQVAAPALAGVALAVTGPTGPTALAAGLLLVAAISFQRISVVEQVAARGPSRPWPEMVEGLRFVFQTRVLRDLSLSAALWTFGATGMKAAIVVLALSDLELGADAFGIALAAAGAGGLLGGVMVEPLMRRISVGRIVAVGPLLGTIGYGLLVITPSGPLAVAVLAAGLFLDGLGSTLWVVAATTLRQSATPLGMLGRLAAVVRMIAASSRPLGALTAGVIAEAVSARASLMVAMVAVAASLVLLVVSPVSRIKRAEDLRPDRG